MRTLENLQLDGGCLVFDFVNTVNTRKPAPEFEYLQTFEDWLVWSEKVGSISNARLQEVREYAVLKEEAALAELHNAIDVREMLYQLFSAIAAGGSPDNVVVDAFNRRLADAFQKIHIDFGPNGPEVRLNVEEVTLNELLLPVLKSAFDILTSGNLYRIKECPRCGWLFLDISKNGKRKWCDMNVCGSREKSLEYYYRRTKTRKPI